MEHRLVEKYGCAEISLHHSREPAAVLHVQRTVEPHGFAEPLDLFRRRLVSQHDLGGISRNQVDE